MAIKNASDLLVYAKTAAAAQVTRIRVKSTNPLIDFDSGQNIILNNVTDSNGVVYDGGAATVWLTGANSGTAILGNVKAELETHNYVCTSVATDGNFKYIDATNGAVGIVPTLELVDGTATFNEGAVIIEIITPGSSAIFDPVAFSTSASFSTNAVLRDVTNKDSGGWSESLLGLKSWEISTESLQSVNPDTPLDGSDFFDKLKQDLPNNALINVSFSDRIRNIIRTNLTQSGVDGFSATTGTQTNLQTDPFSGSTASKFLTAASTNNKYISYTIDATRVENKKVNWSFYVKGSGSTTQASFALSNSSVVGASTVTKIEGQGTIAFVTSSYYKITGLSTSAWTRISFQTDTISLSGSSTLSFYLYPGLYSAQDSDEIFLSSWQIELSPKATDYQDPTDITHWQGNALVSSLSYDAGVEDNYTCSATFTGTDNVYPNGLGPELIVDPEFNLGVSGVDSGAWWIVAGASTIEDSYGKILFTAGGAISYIQSPTSFLTPGDFYLLKYTVSNAETPVGNFLIFNGWEQDGSDAQTELPTSVGTHEVLIKPGSNFLQLKRSLTTADTTIWLSSISLKKVL